MSKRRELETAEMNMTPMIDVVFQMIIFDLENGKNGEVITADNMPVQTLTIEVARRHPILAPRGRISINNATCSLAALDGILKGRYAKFGSFPVLIRADKDAIHEDVRKVMDVCTANGVWKLSFVAIKEAKGSMSARKQK